MDTLLRELERRAILGDLGAQGELHEHWVRFRDPRREPRAGDVLFGLPRASGRAADPARRRSELDRLEVRFREADPTSQCLPVRHRCGWAWARAVMEVRLPESPRVAVEDGRGLVSGQGSVLWAPVLSWDPRQPCLPKGGPRHTSLEAFRRWARWSVVLRVVEEEELLAAWAHQQRPPAKRPGNDLHITGAEDHA